jgi:hypothetical protein
MRLGVRLAGVALMLPAAGCSPPTGTPGQAPPTAAPGVSSPAAAQPGAGGLSSGSPAPGVDPALSTGEGPDPLPTPPGPASADPEDPRDLVGAPVVLTGAVSRRRGCVVLEVRGRRWALTGDAADRLPDGRQTVRGRPVAVPVGCDADFGLLLRGAGN